MKLPIIGVTFCVLWVCICSQEVPRNDLNPRSPKTHFENRNTIRSPIKAVQTKGERTRKSPNSFRQSQEKNEEELRKFASHFTTTKASNLRHDDPVVCYIFFSPSVIWYSKPSLKNMFMFFYLWHCIPRLVKTNLKISSISQLLWV